MKHRVKKLVKELPGLHSYCLCTKPCSGLNVDHVVPKSYLRRQLSASAFNHADRDMHNLFRCCINMNQDKAAKMLGDDYRVEGAHNSYLARSALYMDWKYGLGSPEDLILEWKLMALESPVFEFETQRNEIIKSIQKSDNPFISEHPSKTVLY